MNARLSLGLVVGALCIASPSTALASSSSSTPAVGKTAQASALPALQAAPVGSVSKEVATFAASEVPAKYGVDVSATRRLAAPGGGFWDVIPGRDGVCFYIESEDAGSCASHADAAAGRLFVAIMPPGAADALDGGQPVGARATYLGIAPSGGTRASATLGSGEVSSANVTSNGLYRVLADNTVETFAVSRSAGRPVQVYSTAMRKASFNKLAPPPARARISSTLEFQYIPWATCCSYTYDSAGSFGQYRNLSQVWASVNNAGPLICVNAQNLSGGTWAGNVLCGYNPIHDYNHIYVRRGVICANGGGNYVTGYGNQSYVVG